MPGLQNAVREVLKARGLAPAVIADRMGEKRSKTTFYRVLTGRITYPRLNTLIQLCRLLQISPTELLEMAGLWTWRRRSTDPLDIQLRKAFGEIQQLPTAAKQVAVGQIESLLPWWKRLARSRTRSGKKETVRR